MSLAIKVFLLSMTPVGECRISIPYGIYSGLSPFESFLISFLGNTLMGLIIYSTIDFISRILLNKEPLRSYYNRFIYKKLKKLKIHSLGITLSLLLFIATPLPGTGAFTGAILARVLGFSMKEAFTVIGFGVLFASLIVTFITLSSTLFIF